MKESVIKEKSFQFALQAIDVYKLFSHCFMGCEQHNICHCYPED
jgi:hypothetical protein